MGKKNNKNVSKTIKNGQFIITFDNALFGSDGESTKQRMATVVDSNKKDELAIVKYTTSTKNGTPFKNDKGFVGYGNAIHVFDNNHKPITVDGIKFIKPHNKRNISPKQSNAIKKDLLTNSKYKNKYRKDLRRLKGRKNKKTRK